MQTLKAASYQGPIFEKQVDKNLDIIFDSLTQAEQNNVDILCMPECFLQGYFESKQEASKYAVELDSPAFIAILNRFKHFKRTTLLLGLNEKVGPDIFNTVVVIEAGQIIGKYQKAYTYSPYDYFSLGSEFPIFEKKGVKYSIVICYDILFREPALLSSLNGAQILFCPMFNRIERSNPMLPYMANKNHFIARAFDTNCWLICSDIIWDSETHICPGYATILDADGEIVRVSQPFDTTLLTYEIPLVSLQKKKKKRVLGNKDLVEKIYQSYQNM